LYRNVVRPSSCRRRRTPRAATATTTRHTRVIGIGNGSYQGYADTGRPDSGSPIAYCRRGGSAAWRQLRRPRRAPFTLCGLPVWLLFGRPAAAAGLGERFSLCGRPALVPSPSSVSHRQVRVGLRVVERPRANGAAPPDGRAPGARLSDGRAPGYLLAFVGRDSRERRGSRSAPRAPSSDEGTTSRAVRRGPQGGKRDPHRRDGRMSPAEPNPRPAILSDRRDPCKTTFWDLLLRRC
jgi:hypothetical protein